MTCLLSLLSLGGCLLIGTGLFLGCKLSPLQDPHPAYKDTLHNFIHWRSRNYGSKQPIPRERFVYAAKTGHKFVLSAVPCYYIGYTRQGCIQEFMNDPTTYMLVHTQHVYWLLYTASLIRANAQMSVKDKWSEPPIVWKVVAARKGENRWLLWNVSWLLLR